MRPLGSLARLGIGAFVASCASAPLGGDTRAQDGLAIAPYGVHDECFDLAVGDKLDYRYESRGPVEFDIRYREDGFVVSPIVRPHSIVDSDIFEALVPARYCATWQAGAEALAVTYRLLVRRASPRGPPLR
jgi:hypothetical protein